MRRYRHNVKSDHERYELAKAKDKERKRVARDDQKNKGKTAVQLQNDREKSRLAKQRYREMKRKEKQQLNATERTRTPNISRTKKTEIAASKKFEEKLKHQQKKMSVLKSTMWRMRIALGKGNETTSISNDTYRSPFTSRWSRYRKEKAVESAMPNTPDQKAAIIQKMSQSPRTKAILVKKGAILSTGVQKKLKVADAILQSLDESLTKTKAHGGSLIHQKKAHECLPSNHWWYCEEVPGHITTA